MRRLRARSISRSLAQGLVAGTAPQGALPLRVLAVFEDVWDFVAADGRVVALVTPEVGDGPLNVVVGVRLSALPRPATGAPASICAERLSVGEVEVALDCPRWEPRPDWDALRRAYPRIRGQANNVLRLAGALAREPGLLALLDPGLTQASGMAQVMAPRVQLTLEGGPGPDWLPERFATIAAQVAGLGVGLTPSGDDWLAGLLTWAWLAHPTPEAVGAAVFGAAGSRTTTLSAAFLRRAAAGECDATWQAFLDTLAAGRPDRLAAALQPVLAHGATSGADRLAGFLAGMLKIEGSASGSRK